MRIYTVHEPEADRDLYEHGPEERTEFVKDGFSWPGFFLSLPWLVWHRLWLPLALYVLLAGALAAATRILPVSESAGVLLGVLPALFIGLDGNDMRRRKLARRGFEDRGRVVARNLEEAEILYFGRADRDLGPDRQAAGAAHNAVPQPSAMRPAFPSGSFPPGRDVLGLFPEPASGNRAR